MNAIKKKHITKKIIKMLNERRNMMISTYIGSGWQRNGEKNEKKKKSEAWKIEYNKIPVRRYATGIM